jgi:hypothetical protein
MTEKHSQPMNDDELDRVLSDTYPEAPTLSGQFEERVMHKVKAIDHARSRRRRVARLMAVYWGVATAIMSGLLAGSPLVAQPATEAVVAIILICAICGGGLAWYIARQSGIRLQSLFARTLM